MSKFITSTSRSATALLALTAGAALCVGGPAMAADDVTMPAAQPAAHSDTAGAAVTDAVITAAVKAKFVASPEVKSADISVTTTNGIVALTGAAADAASRDKATDLAYSVAGVKGVDNTLTTSTLTTSTDKTSKTEEMTAKTADMTAHARKAVSDSWITTKVKSTILADSVSKGFEVSVETHRGVVSLTGQLASHDAIEHVKTLAEQVEGVKSVETAGLTVRS